MPQLVEVEARRDAEDPLRAMSLKASSTTHTHKVGTHPNGSGSVSIREVARLVAPRWIPGGTRSLRLCPSDEKGRHFHPLRMRDLRSWFFVCSGSCVLFLSFELRAHIAQAGFEFAS